MTALQAEMGVTLGELDALPGPDMAPIRAALADGIDALSTASDWLLELGETDLPRAAAGASPYLHLFGTVAGGWLLARSAAAAQRHLAANDKRQDFLTAKIQTARFYADNILPRATADAAAVNRGSESTLALEEGLF